MVKTLISAFSVGAGSREAQLIQPKRTQLLQERLLEYKKPFSATSIYYFGPFVVKVRRRFVSWRRFLSRRYSGQTKAPIYMEPTES